MNNSSLEFFKSLLERDSKMLDMVLRDLNATAPSSTMTTASSELDGKVTVINARPYMNIKFVNDVLTIVLHDGNIVSKSPATVEDFQRARNAQTELDLFIVCMSKEGYEDRLKKEKEAEDLKNLAKAADILGKHSEFELRDGSVYMKGIDRSLPPLLVQEFVSILARKNPLDVKDPDEYIGLKRFWMWCCLNPRAEVADKLFNFLKKNAFRITKQGFFTALRNVVTVHGGTEFVQFVSETYNKVKAVWKKSPDKYHVFVKDGKYSFIHIDDMYEDYEEEYEDVCYDCDGEGCEECDFTGIVICENEGRTLKEDLGEDLGVLTDLYLDLPNRKENRFTDAHTGTFDIRVGRVVNMDPAACRWNTDDCGAEGLHFTSDEIHYVGCGDQSVLVLINPMKVVGIGESKGRCWEYLPIMTVPREEATKLLHDLDFDTMELDEVYVNEELENLQQKVIDGFTAEAKKYSVNFPSINHGEVRNIVASLNQMKSEISGRVKKVK